MNVALNLESTAGISLGSDESAGIELAGDGAAAWALGRSQIALRSSTSSGHSPAASFSGDGSFRSGWQSMLRASGAGIDGENVADREPEAEKIDTTVEFAEGTVTKSAKITPRLAQSCAMVTSSGALHGNLSPFIAHAQPVRSQRLIPAANASTRVLEQAEDDRTSEPASTQSSRASGEAHGARNVKSGKHDSGARQPAIAVHAATVRILDLANAPVPAPAQVPPLAPTRVQPQPAAFPVGPTDRFSDRSPGSTPELSAGVVEMEHPQTLAGSDLATAAGPAKAMVERSDTGPAAAAGTLMTAPRGQPHEEIKAGTLHPASSATAPVSENDLSPLPSRAEESPQSPRLQNPIETSRPAETEKAVSQANQPLPANSAMHGATKETTSSSAQLPDLAAIANPASLESGSLAGGATGHPTKRAANAGGVSSQGTRALPEQPAGAASEASVSVGTPLSARAYAGSTANVVAGPAGASQTGRPETFAELDRGSSVSAPKWIYAGAHQAEAGFEDPALGWVGVRADLSRGNVHASLLPGTAEAAQALGAHMAGLSAYLAERHSPVATLTLADSGAGSGTTGSGQHLQHDAQQNAETGSSVYAQASRQAGNRKAADAPAQPGTVKAAGSDVTPPVRGPHGMHISVMA
jgi:hypothetical protein